MARVTTKELAELLGELRSQMATLSERLARVEAALPAPASAGAPAPVTAAAPAQVRLEAVPDEILMVISAAVAAFLGVRAQVRQVRLVRSPAWAQQGRVSIQASHRLHY